MAISERDELSIPPAVWNQSCSEEDMASLSMLITDWKPIAPHLGLDAADEEEIVERDPRSVGAQKIAMLRKWKQKKGTAATYKKLCDVFKKCSRQDLVEKIEKQLQEQDATNSSTGIIITYV